MRIIIATIFPDFVKVIKEYGVISQAVKDGKLSIEIMNLRDFAEDKHKTVDDYPYGGGPGMVMKPEPFYRLYDYIVQKFGKPFVIMTSPQGEKFDNNIAVSLSRKENILILCGRYEGVDERIMKLVDMELSIGDYVLSGGELAAMVMCDAISRFVPGVVDEESLKQDSFFNDLLDHPHYTRPAVFRDMKVPDVLLSGNHEDTDLYRLSESLRRTAIRRPDLFIKHDFTEKDKKALILLIRGSSNVK